MTDIAVIGLGTMGLPVAKNLIKAGHTVVGYNRSPTRMEAFVAAGGISAASVAEASARSDVVFTVVPDSPDVENVATGSGGIFENSRPGTFWLDLSTITPLVARRLATDAVTAGLRPLDAPVSGGEQGAIDGTLSIMVGGSRADFDAVNDMLTAIGRTIVHVGPAGAGQTVKAANQLIVATHIQILSEALMLVEAQGLDARTALEVLAGGLAGSRVLDQKWHKMLAGDYRPGFRLELHHKDLGIAMSTARETGVFAPLGALVAQIVAASVQTGRGGLDHAALFAQVRALSAPEPSRRG